MARETKYNKVYDKEIWDKVNPENKKILEYFIDFKHSANKSDNTTYQYEQQIRLFLIWNYINNEDRLFVDIKKRDFSRFFGYNVKEGKSSNRISSLKSVLSSFSTFIEDMLDEEYPTYKNLVKSIDIGSKDLVRKKTIFSEQEVQECLDKLVSLKKYQEACYFALAVSSGARRAELIRFKTEYINDENIIFGCMYETEEIKTKGRGKSGKMLKKYILKDTFKPYFDLWMKDREEKGIESEWMFVRRDNGKKTYSQATIHTANSFAKTISGILDGDFYAHSLRHFLNTKLRKNNIPDHVIISFFGWSESSGGTLVNLYDDSERKDKFGEYFSKDGIKKVAVKGIGDL